MRRFFSLVLILAAVGCSKTATTAPASTPASGAQATATQEPAIKPVPAELPDIIAKVNGETISKADVEKAVQAIEQQNGGPVPPDQRDRVIRGVLDQLVSLRLLVQETRARKLTAPTAEVDARIAQLRGQFPTEDAFKQALASQKVTIEQLRADAQSELNVTKMLQTEIESKVSVTPAQIQDFYAKNPDRFKQGERARASHILLRVPEQADAAAKATVKTKADDVLKQVRAGKDFAALAKQYSEDPGSAPNGGDLNYFQKGQMVGPFDQAVFSLKVGEVSGVVETQFGFHIIKVTDKQPERTVPLDEVRPQVQQFLENQARQEQTQALLKSLAAKGKIEIFI